MSDFQTVTFIRNELSRRGLTPISGLGQHFLIDGNLLHLMVEEAGVGENDLVLEVGCGTGSLTVLLAQRGGHVIAVELDERLLEIAQEALARFDNVTFWKGDVLSGKHTLAPDLTHITAERWTRRPGLHLKVVSDLPYKVATPVIVNLWESELPIELMLVTVQRELAERLVAQPGTKAYGALTVKVAVWAQAEVLRVLPASVFWPRPAVASAFVRLRRRREPLVGREEYRWLVGLVEALFRHRRKTLARGLKVAGAELGLKLPGALVSDLAGAQRVEQLTVAELITLSRTLRRPDGTRSSAGKGQAE